MPPAKLGLRCARFGLATIRVRVVVTRLRFNRPNGFHRPNRKEAPLVLLIIRAG